MGRNKRDRSRDPVSTPITWFDLNRPSSYVLGFGKAVPPKLTAVIYPVSGNALSRLLSSTVDMSDRSSRGNFFFLYGTQLAQTELRNTRVGIKQWFSKVCAAFLVYRQNGFVVHVFILVGMLTKPRITLGILFTYLLSLSNHSLKIAVLKDALLFIFLISFINEIKVYMVFQEIELGQKWAVK